MAPPSRDPKGPRPDPPSSVRGVPRGASGSQSGTNPRAPRPDPPSSVRKAPQAGRPDPGTGSRQMQRPQPDSKTGSMAKPDPKTGFGAKPDPKTGAVGKADSKTAAVARQAAVAAKATGRGAWRALLWIVPIILAIVGLYALFVGTGPAPERKTADGTLRDYTTFVRGYVPPSNITPTQVEMNAWLDYFDADSRSWFESNVDKLSFIANSTNPGPWREMPRERRRIEAMRYLILQPPLRGITEVRSQRYEADGAFADVEVRSGNGTYSFRMRLDKRAGWRIDGLMGRIDSLDQQIRGVILPTS